jgi:Tfp pilus assembly protein PilN
MAALSGGEPVDGRELAGLEKRIVSLTAQIGKTVDLAAQMDHPAPVLRRVQDLEHQRSQLVGRLQQLRQQRDLQEHAVAIDASQVRALLRRLFAEIADCASDADRRAAARQALCEAIERIELDPSDLTARVHYAVHAGDMGGVP